MVEPSVQTPHPNLRAKIYFLSFEEIDFLAVTMYFYPIKMNENYTIYFDGVCNLCNFFIDFLIKRDKKRIFKYASLQSKVGQDLLKKNNLSPNELKSVVLQVNGKIFFKSKAAILILSKLPFPWSLMVVFKIVPFFISNVVYDFIAKNRYQWFGKKETCRLPTEEEKALFIE